MGEIEVDCAAARQLGIAIVTIDGERVAVYRDGHGKVQAVSAVCTHLGCMLEWDNAEKHWDCKCHGSSFKPDGEPFAGPATMPLAKKKLASAGRRTATK